jgi:hypothetical protein
MERQQPGTTTSDDRKRDPHESRSRGREHALMEMLIGRWHVQGHNALAAPNAPGTPVSGEQSYEWLPGRFFVLGRWSRRFGDAGDDAHVGTSIIGHDPDRGGLFAHHYDNLGYAREYVVLVNDHVWSLSGRHERARIELSLDGASFHETWQLSKDGVIWQPLCELVGRRHE